MGSYDSFSKFEFLTLFRNSSSMNKMSLFLVLLKDFDSVGTSNLQFLTDLDN